ncbi:hypothetical protein M432DRAFT_11587 [Thermoascus aurantiacus ATCC 26904]
MSLPSPRLESLPNELLGEIILNLSTDPPSTSRLHEPPSLGITESQTRDLKHLSYTSSRFHQLVRPLLFRHARFNLEDLDEFLSFIKQSGLSRHVKSIVVIGSDTDAGRRDAFWWHRVLSELDPLRITIVATPLLLGDLATTRVTEAHSWAFDIPLQILHLEQDISVHDRFAVSPELTGRESLFRARPWASFFFNESSFLRAYNHYEYFLLRVPSLFEKWGAMTSARLRTGDLPDPLPSLSRLTSFRYTAVFPFYNHVRLVLNAVEMMTNLRSLSVQLAPCRNDKILEEEQRGSMDPNDPWMEILTGYSLIAHSVMLLGQTGNLERFQACDYELDALQSDLAALAGDVLADSGWIHDGHGTWTIAKVKGTPVGQN